MALSAGWSIRAIRSSSPGNSSSTRGLMGASFLALQELPDHRFARS
jgi:hypothetical protein